VVDSRVSSVSDPLSKRSDIQPRAIICCYCIVFLYKVNAGAMPATDTARNEVMGSVAPELLSLYAKYPLKQLAWLSPNGIGPNSAPGFIEDAGANIVKEHYVYGAGPKGRGHYHILTREAYTILYVRLQNTTPVVWCCFADSRKAGAEHFDVRQICYNRSVSPVPDDVVAAKTAEEIARGVAQAHYNCKSVVFMYDLRLMT
jgi:hypothetical protein